VNGFDGNHTSSMNYNMANTLDETVNSVS